MGTLLSSREVLEGTACWLDYSIMNSNVCSLVWGCLYMGRAPRPQAIYVAKATFSCPEAE